MTQSVWWVQSSRIALITHAGEDQNLGASRAIGFAAAAVFAPSLELHEFAQLILRPFDRRNAQITATLLPQ